MSRTKLPRAALVGCAFVLTVGCIPEGEHYDVSVEPGSGPEVAEDSTLALLFEEAAAEAGIPVDVLKAVAHTETALEPAIGEVEFEGQPAPYGLMGLRGDELAAAAELVGEDIEVVKTDDRVNLRAGAALLARYADEAGLDETSRLDPLAWAPALARLGHLEEDLAQEYATDVMFKVRTGLAVPMEDGSTFVIGRNDPDAESMIAKQASGLSAAGVTWLPSPNYNSRGGSRVEMVVIHTCEGAYSGCVGWLRQSQAQASAHYVVKENGGQVAQLVDENNRAWHVAASYRKSLNGNQLPARNGQSVNTFSIGIEHGGRASQSSWPAAQINRSVSLVRDITGRHNIPRDRYHIVAHGKLQPENRTDPGPNWPWTSYLAAISAGSGGGGGGTTPTVITVDNATSGRFRASSNWGVSSWASGRIGANYRYRSPGQVSDLAEFKVNVPAAGRYEVFTRVPGNGYNNDAPFFVNHAGGRTTVHRNLSQRGAQWVSLGTYSFNSGDQWAVQASCWTTGTGYVIADAVRFERR